MSECRGADVGVKRRWLAGVIALVWLAGATLYGCATPVGPTETGVVDSESTTANGDDSSFARAFADKAVDRELEGQGIVSKLLTDDTDGARHQRFIVTFKGEYEWNAQGGVMHWIHHDPSGSHAPGWIRHDGRMYQ
ncbi:MAG: DUF3465 domain-containing protein [Thermoleophilia bacterium]